MPYPSEHAARVRNPDDFQQDSFRSKEITDGIRIIAGKLKGKSKMAVQAYRFNREKFTPDQARAWLKEHKIDYIDFEPAKSILSSVPVVKGKDIILAFVRDGTEAFDNQGNKYIITAEALDADWKTWEGGHITANHKVMENGKITEVWREKPFVFGRITGLSEELLAMVLSPAYQGTSQESEPIEISNKNRVMRLKGIGTTFVFYPEVPACPLTAGCGEISVASLIPNFSLNTSQLNSQVKSTQGGTKGNMTDYTQEQMKDVLAYMKSHPDMMTDDMKAMMGEMVGSGAGSAQTAQTASMQTEIDGLKSMLESKDTQMATAIKSAIEAHDAKLKSEQALAEATKELYSVMKKETADEFLKTKPGVEVIKSTVVALKSSAQVGAGQGSSITSTEAETKLAEAEKSLKSIKVV